VPSRGKVDARERVERDGVRPGTGDVAEDDVGLPLVEQRTDTLAQGREIGASDRAAECERDRLRRWGCHHGMDRLGGQKSSVGDR
jgi:hypothetical protein